MRQFLIHLELIPCVILFGVLLVVAIVCGLAFRNEPPWYLRMSGEWLGALDERRLK